MAVTVADVKALSLRGEFDDLTDAQIQLRIDLAESLVNREVWDRAAQGSEDRGDDGVLYLAAHFLVVDQRSSTAAAGPVTGEAAGGMSRQYGWASGVMPSHAMLMRTSYGQTYLMLLRSLPLTPLVTNTTGGGLYNAG